MKKILLMTLICGGMLSASAQTTDSTNTNAGTTTTTTTTTHQYYYYPSANVYWDQASGNYWYKDNDSQWKEAQTLPSTVTLDNNAEKYSVDYNGTDPWKNNAEDIKKYKEKKDGTIKIKPEKH